MSGTAQAGLFGYIVELFTGAKSPTNVPVVEAKKPKRQQPKPLPPKTKPTKPKPPAPEYRKITNFAGKSFRVGEKIETPTGLKMKVVAKLEDGRRGRVVKATDKSGRIAVLKIPIDRRADTLESIAKEMTKISALEKYGIRHAKVYEQAEDYLVKEYIDGQRADEWLVDWEKKGSPTNTPEVRALLRFFREAAAKGIYIGDLNRKNMIFDGSEWVVIDSGGVKKRSPEIAAAEYRDKMVEKWSRSFRHLDDGLNEKACGVLQNLLDKGLKSIK